LEEEPKVEVPESASDVLQKLREKKEAEPALFFAHSTRWSEEEKMKLLQLEKKYHRDFAKIADFLGTNRTPSVVRSMWYYLQKKDPAYLRRALEWIPGANIPRDKNRRVLTKPQEGATTAFTFAKGDA
jgi:predicted CopG family antitoxin